MADFDLMHYVPTYIDQKSKFLFFDQDVALVSFGMFVTGFAFGYAFIGLVLGVTSAIYYNKLKAGYHPDYILHLSYWVANSPKPRELPHSYNRKFLG